MQNGLRKRASRNKTLTLSQQEYELYKKCLVYPGGVLLELTRIMNRTICGNLFSFIDTLPKEFADLLIIDPLYNLDKNFNGYKFSKSEDASYADYFNSWFLRVLALLKPYGSVYVCSDWKSAVCLYQVMRKYTNIGKKDAAHGRIGKTHARTFGLGQKEKAIILMWTP